MKFTEWQGSSGRWYTGDCNGLPHGSNNWYNVPRMLGMDLCDFLLLLKNKYKASNFWSDKNAELVVWSWKRYEDCHKYTLFVNREAKKRNFHVGG
jgi:hypothetical protein